MKDGIGLRDGHLIIITSNPYAVHYTRGGPWFSEWQDVELCG